MGMTIVHKSGSRKKRGKTTKALILAGGAVTGGSFKAGGLKALDDYLINFRVTDFDLFVGISSGSLLAAPLAGGIPPASILRSLDGTSRHFTQLKSWHYYWPNLEEIVQRPMGFIVKAIMQFPLMAMKLATLPSGTGNELLKNIWKFLQTPTSAHYDDMMTLLRNAVGTFDLPSIVSLLPSGLFDNRPIERYIRENIERNGLTNQFRAAQALTKKRLYICCAMTLDGASRVVFGPDEKSDVLISEAVMASTAMPGFYRPARIQGVAYVDGGVKETADLDIAVKKGAELIVCYNPFRPYERDAFIDAVGRNRQGGRPSSGSIFGILNQIFRAAFHARLQNAMKQLERDPHFYGDILLIEPDADDADFFLLNPLSLSNSVRAAQMGFESVRESIEEQFDQVKKILALHGIAISRERVEKEHKIMMRAKGDEEGIRSILEGRST